MSTVTAVVCTRNRSDSVLSLCLMALGQQTRTPNHVFIYDDNDKDKQRDLRNVEPYRQIFTMWAQKGISYFWCWGNGQGQVRGHKISLRECKTDYIWRVDDDDVPEPTCLEKLMLVVESDSSVGACGGLVLDVAYQGSSKIASNKIEDIYLGLNKQWFRHTGKPYDVDHLYSSFVYKRAEDYYPSNLSRIGHREETIMTYRMKRAGYRIIVEPGAVTWHLKASSGGIRDGYKEMWEKDEAVFAELMRDWGVKPDEHKIITLDNGIGDHYAFLSILPALRKRYRNLAIACCYPDVFHAYPDLNLISIGEAYGGGHREGVYKYMVEHDWNGEKGNIIDAFKEMERI